MRVRLHRSQPVTQQDAEARPRLRLVEDERRDPPRDEFAHERRLRDAGGPDDTATYHCGCGYIFEAPVTTSVACPHCGGGQAW